MARALPSYWPTGWRTVFFDGDEGVASTPTLSKGVSDGRIRRLAPRLYTADLNSDPADIVAENLWRILGRMLPGAVVVDRSAAENGKVVGGVLHMATEVRRTHLTLPGLEVRIRPPGLRPEIAGDLPWPHGLHMSRPARTLVDNLAPSRSVDRRAARTLSRAELEDWLAAKAVSWDQARMDRLHAESVELAEGAGESDQIAVIEGLFEQLAGRAPLRPDSGVFFRAVAHGKGWDERRVETFERLASGLAKSTDPDVPEFLPAPENDKELPFFESYFSNYIEGTVFTVDEARSIVETQQPPPSRPADGHDILGTYRCVADAVGRSAKSDDPSRLIGYLCERHKTILAGRPEMRPGRWKDSPNQAGGYVFTDPELVEGTLLKGFESACSVPAGFRRALFMMMVVTEVHPFADGNGRVARVMMNAEMSSVGAARIVIPSVYRNEYIACLRRTSTSEGKDVSALMRVMGFAWRWTAAMPWDDRAAAEGQMHATNALREPDDAAVGGVKLTLP
ncbi:MAG: Fic family protein [bacterium]|nr:Fic family protein [bacterium]